MFSRRELLFKAMAGEDEEPISEISETGSPLVSNRYDESYQVLRQEAEYYKGRYMLLLNKYKGSKNESAFEKMRDVMRLWQVKVSPKSQLMSRSPPRLSDL